MNKSKMNKWKSMRPSFSKIGMRLISQWAGGLILGSILGSVVLADTNTRVTNPSALLVELGGRGLLWSFGVDRVLSENLSAGVGVGSVSTSTSNNAVGQSSMVFPVYLNYYFSRDAGSLFATAGASLLTNSSTLQGLNSSIGSLQFSSSPIFGHAGLGYEYRSDAGYLVRVTAYALFAQNVSPWGGISLGYSF